MLVLCIAHGFFRSRDMFAEREGKERVREGGLEREIEREGMERE